MNCFISRLPRDIILKIIPYTYNFQNKNLLDDIKNYKEIKTTLENIYYETWIVELQSLDPEDDKNWLINDIFAYANDYNAIMYGYIDKFYNIFKRNVFLQANHENIDNYIYSLQQKHVSSQINIFLGLLTIDERNELLHLTLSSNN